MKKILVIIGAVFVKIWRWIKETAWVQPLLIVGIIFAVIFSIPSITSWVEGIAEDLASAETYYKKYRKSLKGAGESDAQKLIDNIMDVSNDDNLESAYGEKFFVAFVSSTCSACEAARAGFETLQKNYKDQMGDYPFKLYTVFSDQGADEDWEDWKSESPSAKTAFVAFLNRNADFLQMAADAALNSDYFLNGKLSETSISYLENGDSENFQVPTIMLVDYTDDSPVRGVSEVMFGVEGNDSYEKADLLLDAWTHSGDFKI